MSLLWISGTYQTLLRVIDRLFGNTKLTEPIPVANNAFWADEELIGIGVFSFFISFIKSLRSFDIWLDAQESRYQESHLFLYSIPVVVAFAEPVSLGFPLIFQCVGAFSGCWLKQFSSEWKQSPWILHLYFCFVCAGLRIFALFGLNVVDVNWAVPLECSFCFFVKLNEPAREVLN